MIIRLDNQASPSVPFNEKQMPSSLEKAITIVSSIPVLRVPNKQWEQQAKEEELFKWNDMDIKSEYVQKFLEENPDFFKPLLDGMFEFGEKLRRNKEETDAVIKNITDKFEPMRPFLISMAKLLENCQEKKSQIIYDDTDNSELYDVP